MHLRTTCLLTLLGLQSVFGQPAAPPIPKLPDDAVLVEFDDGVKFTMADFKAVYAARNPAQQQAIMSDRMGFLQQYAFLRKLAQIAEKDKLAEQSPYKEAFEEFRLQTLSQAMIREAINRVVVTPEELAKFYETNKSKYA